MVAMKTSKWMMARPSHEPRLPESFAGLKERMYINVSQRTPIATWVPCVPVRVKKVEPRMLLVIVMCFSVTNSLNSYTWHPRKMEPKKIVVSSDQRMLFRLFFCMAFTAKAIMSDDISRMKVEKDVSSMLKIFAGFGIPGRRMQTVNQVRRDERTRRTCNPRPARPT